MLIFTLRRVLLVVPSLHPGVLSFVQHQSADQLDVEVALADGALGGLARTREGLGQKVVERLSAQVALAQSLVALAELVIALELELRLEVVDARDALLEELELLALAETQGPLDNGHRRDGS